MILLGEQIVKFKDGTQKTLEEFVSEGATLTPETPVTVSDDSMELEDYIKEIAEESGGIPAWQNGGSVTDCSFNVAKVLPDAMKATIEGNYTDICIVAKCHDASFTYPDCIVVVPFSWFKAYEKQIVFYVPAFSAGNPQGGNMFWFTITKDGSDYKLTYVGANHFYNQGTQIDVEFYVR